MSWYYVSIFGGRDLTPEEAETLKHFKYNEETDQLEGDREIVTILDSFKLGEQHKISSGGQIVVFDNISDATTSYHLAGGFYDQSQEENQGSAGLIYPHGKVFGNDLLQIEVFGPADESATTFYDTTTTVPFDLGVFGNEFIIEEDIAADDYLFYSVWQGTSEDDIKIYEQLTTGNAFSAGDTVQWWYTNPLIGPAGTPTYQNLKVARGSRDADRELVLVRAAALDNSVHYSKTSLRTYEQKDVAFTDDIEAANYDLVLTTDNEEIQGHSLTNALGYSIPFPSTVVVDEDGNILTDE